MNDEPRGNVGQKPDIGDFERTVNLQSSPIASEDHDDAGDTLRFDNLDALLSDEPPLPDTSGASANTASEEDIYDLDIQSGELHELDAFKAREEASDTEATIVLNDAPPEAEEPDTVADSALANAHEQDSGPRKVELTENDYAPPETTPQGEETSATTSAGTEVKPDTSDSVEESASPANTMSGPSSPTSGSTSLPQPESETPTASPQSSATSLSLPASEASASPTANPPEQLTPRASIMPLLLAMLALGAGGGALWQSWQANGQLDQLEQRLDALEHRALRPARPDADIKALNERVTQLNARLEKHLKTVAMNASPGETTRLAATAPATAGSPEPTTVARPTITPTTPANASRISRPNRKAAGTASPSSGPWVVNLVSFANPSAARAEIARLKRMGIAAETVQVRAGGKTWQRVRVAGFASRASAEQARRKLARKLGIGDTWVSRR